MCKHTLHYLLKQNDDGIYAGLTMELDVIVAHANTPDEIDSIIRKASKQFLSDYEDVHQQALENTLHSSVRYSSGTPLAIKEFVVECPPHVK